MDELDEQELNHDGIEEMSEEAMLEALAREKRKAQDRLNSLGSMLQRKAEEQVTLKNQIENRWLEDLAQYSGQYDDETLKAIRNRKGSEVFVNITRHKANAAEARLADMLFPTDDKNWGLKPTPVPELNAMKKQGGMVMDQQGQTVDIAAEADKILAEAHDRAKLMEREIDDQLNESGYNGECRDVIHDAVVLGTGVIKAPIVEGRSEKRWIQNELGGQSLVLEQVLSPCARRVSPWDFFPDMSATRLTESAFVFERHYFTRTELADIAQLSGFMKDAIKEIITEDKGKRSQSSNTYLSRLRQINGYTSELENDNRYEVWEYHGSISEEDLDAAGVEYDKESLYELTGTVWFCDGKIFKIALNPMDTGDNPYSVFCFEEDDTSIFGLGVPFLMKNAQAVINSSWRMIMDNSGLSSAPQIIVNRTLVEPADGDWTITPKKLWFLKDKTRSVHEAFGAFDINSHQNELANIFQIARQLADEETSVPLIAQGQESNHVQTASGMSMLMNNSNIVLRRSVKVWDDNVTRPLIQRFYDWNMQFNDKEEIKGDYKVDARGSSALMEREIQMQNMTNLMQISQSPAFAPITKFPDLYRMALRHMQIPANDVVMSQDEIDAAQKALAEQGQQPEDPIAMGKLQLEQQRLQLDSQVKQSELQIKQQGIAVEEMRAKLDYEAVMTKIADQRELSLQQLEQQMGLKQMDLASKERLMAFETQVKQAYGEGL